MLKIYIKKIFSEKKNTFFNSPICIDLKYEIKKKLQFLRLFRSKNWAVRGLTELYALHFFFLFCIRCYLAKPHVGNAKSFIAKLGACRILIIQTTFTPNANTIRQRNFIINCASFQLVIWKFYFLRGHFLKFN